MKVFAVLCGHRNRCNTDVLLDSLFSGVSKHEYLVALQRLTDDNSLSNSEIALAVAAQGAHNEGATVRFVCLNQVFDRCGNTNSQLQMVIRELVYDASGVIFGAPLHFGNPSSYLLQLFSVLAQIKDYPLGGKVIGSVIAGARRNGGQEAGNIFTLFESAQLGACTVGDGPPFSQSGGVLESRLPEFALQDKEGVESCARLGSRVVRALKLLSHSPEQKGHVMVIVDNERTEEVSEEVLGMVDGEITHTIVNLSDIHIERCIGCDECPVEEMISYRCAIRDGLERLELDIRASDGVIVCLEATQDKWSSYRWQIFIERLRYLRRDDYALANRPILSIQLLSSSRSVPYHVRLMPSAFKHDMLFVGPSLTIAPDDEQDFSYWINRFYTCVLRAKRGRQVMSYPSIYHEEAKRFV
jgi:multimeric flavodoxin WrbA